MNYVILFCCSISVLMLNYYLPSFSETISPTIRLNQSVTEPTVIDSNLKVETVFEGVGFFSNMAFLDTEDILVLDKNEGTVKRFVNGTMLSEPVFEAKVATKSERGMLGIAISKYKSDMAYGNKQMGYNNNSVEGNSNMDKYIFLYFTEAKTGDGDDMRGNDPIGNRLYRYEFINNTRLGNAKLLLDLPAGPGASHNGGGMEIGPDNSLYLSIGNVNAGENRSFWTTVENYPLGKNPDGRSGILRIGQDGHPVVDKNVLGTTYPMNLYYAYGIRNSFGLDFDPVTGNLWDTENGPSFGDELNLVDPVFNSGWNKLQGIWEKPVGSSKPGIVQLNPENLNDFNGTGKYSNPEFTWNTPVGVTGIAFLDSNKMGGQYENDLFVGDFHKGNIYHFDLNKKRTELSLDGPLKDKLANSTGELEKIIFGKGFGGITDLEIGPDGYLYILSLNVGGNNCNPKYPNVPCVPYDLPNVSRIFRIVPAYDAQHELDIRK